MADAVAELEGTLYQQLPALLNELAANHQNVAHTADWCGQTYVTPGEDKAATFERTQSYLKDALLTVAGHMTSAGASLTQTIDLQAVELESLEEALKNASLEPFDFPTDEGFFVYRGQYGIAHHDGGKFICRWLREHFGGPPCGALYEAGDVCAVARARGEDAGEARARVRLRRPSRRAPVEGPTDRARRKRRKSALTTPRVGGSTRSGLGRAPAGRGGSSAPARAGPRPPPRIDRRRR